MIVQTRPGSKSAGVLQSVCMRMARWKTAQLPIAVVDRHHFQTKLSFFFAMFRFLPTCAQRRRGGALSGGFDSCVERRLPNCLDGKMLRVVLPPATWIVLWIVLL